MNGGASEDPGIAISRRAAATVGIIGPLAFLIIALILALLRGNAIASAGWHAWPSSLSIGGPAGYPMTLDFLMLAGSYVVFAIGAVRSTVGRCWIPIVAAGAGWAIVASPVIINFGAQVHRMPTSLHLFGLWLATIGTALAAWELAWVTRTKRAWRSWRVVGTPVVTIAVAILALDASATFEHAGVTKVIFIFAVIAPMALAAALTRKSIV